MPSTPFALFGAHQDTVLWVGWTKVWMPQCIPPNMGTALQGLRGWMHIFGSAGGCMECQAQDCCVGSCSTGSKCDQTQCGLRRCITIVRQTPWDSVKQHLWRCWSITSPGSEWQNYPVLGKQQPLFCVSHPFPPSCLPSLRAVLLMEAEAGGLFVLELVCMKWVMLQSLSKALHTHRLLMPMYLVPGSSEVFLPPDPIFGTAMSEKENVLCAQLQCFHFPTLRHHGLHSWYAENCYEKSSFLCKRSKLGSVLTVLCVFKYAYNKYLEIVSLPFLIFAQWI